MKTTSSLSLVILWLLMMCTIVLSGQRINAQNTLAEDKTAFKKSGTDNYRTLMRNGNKQYDAGNHTHAENLYRKALNTNTKSPQAAFNLGDALYRQKKFEEAGKQFEIAISEMTDKIDKAQAYHNLGNSMLQQQKLEESIDAYQQALRNNPKDVDTKTNLSYAMNLFIQRNQLNQDNNGQHDQDQDQEQEQDKNQDQNRQQVSKQIDRESEQSHAQQKRRMSREDAQRILDVIDQEENVLQEKLQEKKRKGYPNIQKYW